MADQSFRVKHGLEVGVGSTILIAANNGFVGIGSTIPTVSLDVKGSINTTESISINGTDVLTTASADAVALAIALG